MLIPAEQLRRFWGLNPRVIVHVGAHEAEELPDYQRLGWGQDRTVWVEALPRQAAVTRKKVKDLPNHVVLEMVAWDSTGDTVTFSEANNGQSSSALHLGSHADRYPDIEVVSTRDCTTLRLDDALRPLDLERIDLVNLDVQGAELRVLRGLDPGLDRVRAIYSEVNLEEIYVGCALVDEMDEWLATRGFTRVDWEFLPDNWGDALWIRSDALPRLPGVRRSARLARKRARRLASRVVGLTRHHS